MKRIQQLLSSFKNRKRQEGVALIVTLLIMLVLVLLALSIAMQSQSEYLIAVNEQDSISALSYGESALEWVNQEVIDYVSTGPPNLTEILDGINDADNTDDFMPELAGLTLNTALVLDDLDESNEQTTAVIKSIDWDGAGTAYGSENFLAFRLGQDTDLDTVWDGPRAEVMIRVMDNYDPGLDAVDTDNRIRALVAVDYPVFVDDDGDKLPGPRAPRGTARRKLIGRFAPGGNVAIRTDGDLEINGSLEVCGACGGVHANETILIDGSVVTCGEATGTTGIDVPSAQAEIRGGAGLTGEVFIPVINPYDDLYVPDPGVFNTSADTTLPDYLRCPAPGVGLDTDTDPGATKYFAMGVKKISGTAVFQVYKAYYDKAADHWVWRLIDESTDADGLNTQLDNCGRVISGGVRGSTFTRDNPTGTTVAVADAGNAEFYNFAPAGGQGGRYDLESPQCSADETLNGVNRNDFNPNDYWRIPDGSNPFDSTDTALDSSEYTTKTLASSDAANEPLLPGTVRTYGDVSGTPNSNPVTDGIADFEFTGALKTGQGGSSRAVISNGNGQDVFSPLWNSVIFIFGNLEANGGTTLNYVDGAGTQQTINLEDIVATGDGRWKMAWVVFNSARFTGNPMWGSIGANFPVSIVAGRDIEMAGTGQVPGSQDQCPDMSTGSDCTADPPQAAGYAGMVLAHEEVHFSGNVQLDGFIIAEDAATCSDIQSDEVKATGSVQIHYDCTNPANLWGDQSSRLVSWEEVQVTNPDY